MLYQAQVELQRVAAKFAVSLTFFHGRGGALGRGGGPAARSILSLPREAFSGSMRLTEQGEVLAERYNNPHVAHRHLEQLVWSAFTAVARQPHPPSPDWANLMQKLAQAAWIAYRKLVEHPAFGEYYRAVTPINLLEQLPMGSRPAKRKASDRIEDLRAIPWVFSWTQNRCLLPAWFGIGTAYKAVVSDNSEAKAMVADAYQEWPFFTCAIDNAALALAKANMNVFREYCRLADSVNDGDVLSTMILDEFNSSRDAVLEIIGCRDLLDDVPWLQESIHLRNGYVDPLNLAQVELLQRMRQKAFAADSSPENEVQNLASLSVKGIATGMRTTG
jgi:phosphoenolpyruvate carboxylase